MPKVKVPWLCSRSGIKVIIWDLPGHLLHTVTFLVFLHISAYCFDGVLIFSMLVICTCAYMRRVPRLKQWFLSEKKGFLGVFYKGTRH